MNNKKQKLSKINVGLIALSIGYAIIAWIVFGMLSEANADEQRYQAWVQMRQAQYDLYMHQYAYQECMSTAILRGADIKPCSEILNNAVEKAGKVYSSYSMQEEPVAVKKEVMPTIEQVDALLKEAQHQANECLREKPLEGCKLQLERVSNVEEIMQEMKAEGVK